jgi:hypothetical protein
MLGGRRTAAGSTQLISSCHGSKSGTSYESCNVGQLNTKE